MRKPRFSEIFMYKNFFYIALCVFIFVPLFANFVLQTMVLFTKGDIAYGYASDIISYVRDILTYISQFIGYGILAVTMLNFGNNANMILLMAYFSPIINLISSLVVYIYSGGDDILAALFTLTVDMLVNILMLTIIYLYIKRIYNKKNTFLNIPEYKTEILGKNHPYSLTFLGIVIIYFVINLIIVLYGMIGDFIDPSLGVPVNLKEKIWWVMQYVMVFIYSFVLDLSMVFTAMLSEHYIKTAGLSKKKQD